jgi:LPS-assembly lipoprotein
VAGILLSGCGFQLRNQKPIELTPLYLDANEALPFTRLLKQALQDHPEVTLVNDPKAATYRLRLISEGLSRSVQDLSTTGRVRDILLRDRINFEVKTASGEVLLPPTPLTIERVMSYDDRYALAKVNDEAQIYKEMQIDGVHLLLLRLTALHPQPSRDNEK